MAYLGRFDGSEAKHASPAMAAVAGAGAKSTEVSALPTSTKWSVLSSRVEGLVAELGQVIGKQDAYCTQQSTGEGPAMTAVREKMLNTPWTKEWRENRTMFSYGEEMSTDPLEALFLKQLVHLAQAKKVLEVGMFVGYGSVAMLESTTHVEVVSLEIDPYLKDWLSSCLKGFPELSKRHRVVIGPALSSFPKLSGERFDMVFVDANKAEYKRYVEMILEHNLLAPTGTIVADNVLYNGYPYMPSHFDAQPQRRAFGDAIREFNQWVSSHPLLEQVVLPVRDGVSLIRMRALAPSAPLSACPGTLQLRHRSGATCSAHATQVLSWQVPNAGEQLHQASDNRVHSGIAVSWPFDATPDMWQLCDVEEDAVSFRFGPGESEEWSGLGLVYTVSLKARSLRLQLEVTNTGSERVEFAGQWRSRFCEPFTVHELEDKRVDDALDGKELRCGGIGDALVIKDGGRRRLLLTKSNAPDWVISSDPSEGCVEVPHKVCVGPAFAKEVRPGATWCAMHEAKLL